MYTKVLIVDDDANLLSALRRRIGRCFNITWALSAEEALVALRNDGPFAVVISDHHMGRMSGIQFLAEVKEHMPDTVRVMLTGNKSRQLALDAINKAGAWCVLTKPCSVEDLIDAIQRGAREYWLNAEDGVDGDEPHELGRFMLATI